MTIDINELRKDKRPQSSTIVHVLLNRLEAAESARRDDYQNWMTALNRNAELLAKLEAAEIEALVLRAKVAEMERQEPVSWADAFGEPFRKKSEIDGVASPLYALPGAQPAPSVPTESIGKMLTQVMEAVVANGANSVSMPDELVEVAAWLSGVQPNPANGQTRAVRDVIAERRRQIETEGWTPEHDDEHGAGEMAAAAACYALNAAGCGCEVARNWPWDGSWWKPTTSRRDLVKAGALILAEIERLDRMAERQEGA